jgi:hypothetical protein
MYWNSIHTFLKNARNVFHGEGKTYRSSLSGIRAAFPLLILTRGRARCYHASLLQEGT